MTPQRRSFLEEAEAVPVESGVFCRSGILILHSLIDSRYHTVSINRKETFGKNFTRMNSLLKSLGDYMKIEMKNIRKSFGSNDVLKDVTLSFQGGEICALLGENGAGKSTLMNILGGVIPMDSGSILIDEKEVDFETPVDSQEAGIAFIHQELNLINDLPIYENMF